jgi:hypothetical protein
MIERLSISFRKLPDGEWQSVAGRDAWALRELSTAGKRGCTPIDHPGPRWSGYVHKLRHCNGLLIETRHEPHKGPYPGHHARYVLLSDVELLESAHARRT